MIVTRLGPWYPLLLLVVVLKQALLPLTDPDSFWHLRLGATLLDSGSLTTPSEWNVRGGPPWVLTQWLPEVVASAAESRIGLWAVVWLFAASLLALVVIVYLLCRRSAEPLAATVVAALAVLGMSGSLSPRPHMITYILLGITLMAWLRTAQDLRPRWWLIPLTWVWACSHGMWFTGVVLGLGFAAALIVDHGLNRREAGRLLAVPLGSLVAAAVTPLGPKVMLAPFAVGGISAFVTEWQAPSFRTLAPAITLAMILIVAVSWSRSSVRMPWTQIFVLAYALAWTVLAARTVTLGALLIAPLFAVVVQSAMAREPGQATRLEYGVLAGATGAALLLAAVVLPSTAREPAGVPMALDGQIAALPDGARVINDYAVGGWLRYAHPQVEPIVDGLTEAYSVRQLSAYGGMSALAPGWEKAVTDTGADWAVLPASSSLASALEQQLDWSALGKGDGYILLRSPEAASGP